MKKLKLLSGFVLIILLAASCSTPKELYYWGGSYHNGKENTTKYEHATYQYYKTSSPESLCALINVFEDMTSHPGGSTGKIPPGICAEYGFILLRPDVATIYGEHATKQQQKKGPELGSFQAKGLKLLQMEIELYPESATFIAPILKKYKN